MVQYHLTCTSDGKAKGNALKASHQSLSIHESKITRVLRPVAIYHVIPQDKARHYLPRTFGAILARD